MDIKEIVLALEGLHDIPPGEGREDAKNAIEREIGRAGITGSEVNICVTLRRMDPDIAAGKIELFRSCLTWGRGPLEP